MSNWIRARIAALGSAFRGLRELIAAEPHARVHLLTTVVVAGLSACSSLSATEWCAVILAAGFVWSAEAMNTAVERVVDLASPDRHPLAAQAKELAAGAVLIAALAALLVGILIFFPRLAAWF